MFEQTAVKFPEKIAVRFNELTLTYQQLNQQANQLANFLRMQGIGPESVVGLFMERSIGMIVAILGIIKAGGLYLPLDPDYPEKRLSFMFNDSRANLILTTKKLVNRIPFAETSIVAVDDDSMALDQYSAENLALTIKPDNLIYIMYTSGSTGIPKGIMVRHKSVVRLVRNTNYIPFGADNTFLQLAPISFDASTFEIWGSLLNGAELVIAPSGKQSLEDIGSLIKGFGVSVLWLTAGLFHLMVDERLDDLKDVKYLLAGGDILSPMHVEKVLQHNSEHVLVNGYGPTENTTFACCYAMHGTQQFQKSVPIGRPISNSGVLILDRNQKAVPVGVVGELYIVGDGLARGYFNRPELTAERFIPNPYNRQPGARMYKTGDLVRYLSDGNIEFVGRIDSQVKVRGFRIELGEIKSLLEQHPLVREALVTLRGRNDVERQIIAYCIPFNGQTLYSKVLRNYLNSIIPEYMMPASIVILDAFPLTPNGKIDYKALPAPDFETEQSEFVAAKTPTEEILLNIFANVLSVEKVSTTANFFDLGGHSLLATQVISRIRQVFQIELPLRVLFENSDVRRLAQAIDKAKLSSDGNGAPPVVRASEGAAPPLSFAQQRMWFLDQLEPGSPQYHIPSAVRIKGELKIDALQKCLKEIARRHQVLRTSFVTVDEPKIEVIDDVDVLIPIEDISGLDAAAQNVRVKELVVEAAKKPFNLAQAPLFRGYLIKLAEKDFVFELVMHHIISDGWSSGVMIREIGALYETILNGEPSPLPDLEIQYSDYAAWQRNWLQGETLEKQLDYWKNKLGGSKELALPADRPRPAFQTMNGDHLTFRLSKEISGGVFDLSRRENVTPFMTLLAAFQTLLSRYANQEDISVGTPIANRNRSEVENLIGFFINTLVLRSDLSGNPSFHEFVQSIKETTLDAYAHQDVPFEKVVDAVQPQRNTSRSPLFQVMFMMQNLPGKKLDLQDITLEQLEIETNISNFDITMSLEEHDGVLFGAVEYNTDLFNRSTIQRMVAHYENLLRTFVDKPDQNILAAAMASEAERRTIVDEWNLTNIDFGEPRIIHHIIEKQAKKSPEAIAVRFGDKELTYTELNARANKVAHYLKQKGARPDALVGLCMERSLDMIVALLGVLKSG
ncbi:MAG: amino acid adenylation domain-containing protein, partial [Calditrichaeota bacterium]|nr:amino acid adenylation domain-containing protein [Calditrichota bacterium]